MIYVVRSRTQRFTIITVIITRRTFSIETGNVFCIIHIQQRLIYWGRFDVYRRCWSAPGHSILPATSSWWGAPGNVWFGPLTSEVLHSPEDDLTEQKRSSHQWACCLLHMLSFQANERKSNTEVSHLQRWKAFKCASLWPLVPFSKTVWIWKKLDVIPGFTTAIVNSLYGLNMKICKHKIMVL